MELNFRATPCIDPNLGVVSVDCLQFASGTDPSEDLTRSFHREIVRTRDRAIRQGLIALGWTPPPSEPPPVSDDQTSDDVRLRVRARDSATSVAAAERSQDFAGSHKQRILGAIGDDALSSYQISRSSRLTVVQVDRRTHELERDGLIEKLLDGNGDEVTRQGYRVWRQARLRSPEHKHSVAAQTSAR